MQEKQNKKPRKSFTYMNNNLTHVNNEQYEEYSFPSYLLMSHFSKFILSLF